MSSVPSPSPALSAELRCQLRPGRTETFPVRAAETVIGRERGAGVLIPAEGVSRRHAKITLKGNAYYIENLSQAGTFLNGHRDRQGRLAGLVLRPRRLRHLDVITLAKNVDLLFLLFDEARPKGPSLGIVRAALVPKEGEPVELGIGETSLGRSSASNVVLEPSVVSGLHARIDRDGQRVVLRDLDSANGTFLNGERITTSLLRDGDVVSIANVVSYRVLIEMGEVDSGVYRVADEPPPSTSKPGSGVYSTKWKTRYAWDTAEMQEIAELRAQLAAADKSRAEKVTEKAQHGKPGAKPAAKPAAAAKPEAAKPAAKPAEAAKPAPAKPEAPAPPPAAPAPAAPPPAAAKPAPVAKPPEAPAPAPVAPPPEVAKPAPAAKPAAPAPAPQPSGIREVIVSVTGAGPDFTVTLAQPGTHEVGRVASAAVRVSHPTVSRRHARLVLDADRKKLIVEDAGSANPTKRNGEPVTKPAELKDGDVLDVGAVKLTIAIKRG
jgi:pSer/pThr/pTyr-binding forkhead associated (FHA) protein